MAGPTPTIQRFARRAGRKFGVSPGVLLGLIEVESGFNPTAVSSAGARGLTQFIPSTARSYGVRYGGSTRAQKSQIFGAAKYLRDLGAGRNLKLALASYNAGPGNPGAAGNYPNLVLAAAQKYGGLKGVSGKGPPGAQDFGLNIRRPGAAPLPPFDPNQDPTFRLNRILRETTPESAEPHIKRGAELLEAIAFNRAAKAFEQRAAQRRPPGVPGGLDLGGGRAGKRVKGKGAQNIAMGLARGLGQITSTVRNVDTVAGPGVSDHFLASKDPSRAFATDIAARGAQGDRIVAKLARRLGVSPQRLTGTFSPVMVRGFRVQVLWKVSGHHDHVHIGVRRV